jgi:hypothetical protein
MIQLNAMALFDAKDQSAGGILASSGNQTTAGFQSALSAALSATLQEFGINPNQVTLSILPAASASSTPFSSSPTANASDVATLPDASTASAASTGSDAASAASGVESSAAAAASSPATDQAYDDAYWAKQPLAVQALRNMSDYNERTQLATQLSAEGYSIDVPIMVWGWDPAKITAAWEGYGYSCVPSVSDAPVQQAPGFKLPGLTAYDPNNPPAGSIAVS